jgi:hypothetical protein
MTRFPALKPSDKNNNNNNNNNSKSLLPPLPLVKKYKAFHTGRLDLRRDVYEYCDLYEMHTVRYPLHTRNFLYYQGHPTEKSVITVGDEKRITQILEPQYYSSSFSLSSSSSSSPKSETDSYPPYTIVLARLFARRFYDILKFELEQWADVVVNTIGAQTHLLFVNHKVDYFVLKSLDSVIISYSSFIKQPVISVNKLFLLLPILLPSLSI